MLTKKKKRVTRQTRIADNWHKLLKNEAAEKGTTLSKLLDLILKESYQFSGIFTKK